MDHVRFQQVTVQARHAQAGGDDEGAAELFRSALILWRGPALGSLAQARFAADAARLDEMRLSVLEERAAADLALGRYELLVDELTTAVADHPAREVLRRHLMVALYGLDRQVDALAVYRDGRRILVDEYGIEPGPALRAAHDSILRCERAILGDTPSTRPSAAESAAWPGRGSCATAGGPGRLHRPRRPGGGARGKSVSGQVTHGSADLRRFRPGRRREDNSRAARRT